MSFTHRFFLLRFLDAVERKIETIEGLGGSRKKAPLEMKNLSFDFRPFLLLHEKENEHSGLEAGRDPEQVLILLNQIFPRQPLCSLSRGSKIYLTIDGSFEKREVFGRE